MPRVAPEVPSDTDLLCEDCGYILNGLSDDGRCPECGKPVAESATPTNRLPPSWESSYRGFWTSTGAVLFRPSHFFCTMTTRSDQKQSKMFANIHWGISSLLLAIAVHIHADSHVFPSQGGLRTTSLWLLPLSVFFVYLFIRLTNMLAAWLTAWEAAYRGLRLPYRAVLRALHYHAAHYTPIALVVFVTVIAFDQMLNHALVGYQGVVFYLYTLSGEVILAAIYLFWTYWIAMKNIMYANR